MTLPSLHTSLLAVAVAVAPTGAWAQNAPTPASPNPPVGQAPPAAGTTPAPPVVPAASIAPQPLEPEMRRAFEMEANIRFRYLSIPDSVMDIWYFDSDDAGANPLKRPKVRAYALGGEWVVKDGDDNWLFYTEWIGNWMKGGYWDDVEDEPAEHDDGDWVEPNGFGVLAVGANYAHEIHTRPWLSFLFGGGLGAGLVTGELTQWNPGGNEDVVDEDCLANAAAYQRRYNCADDGVKDVPNVVPILDISGSVRFHFADNATVRIDGGFHDMFYVGTSVGAVF